MHDIQPLQTALNLEALAKLKGLPTGAVQELKQAAEVIRVMYSLSIELCVDALQLRGIELANEQSYMHERERDGDLDDITPSTH